VSGILLAGGIIYFSLSLEHFEDLQDDLAHEKKEFSEEQETYFTELNSTKDQISSLLMERSKLRQTEDDLSGKIQTIEEEKSFLAPKLKRLEESFISINKEAGDVEEKIVEAKASVEKEISKEEPYRLRISELTNEIQTSKALLEDVNAEVDRVENNFSRTSNVRKIAHKSFLTSKELLLAQIVKPNYLFYGDQIEIFIDNISPSKKGFFARNGTEFGLKSDLRFLASEQSDFEEEIHYLRCKFAEDSLSFFEIENNQTENVKLQVFEGQKLYLIRTGDFPIDYLSDTPAEPE
jgi:chromosome segregation ATPase